MTGEGRRMSGKLGAAWGVAGVAALLGYAVFRLAPLSLEALASPWQWYHGVFAAVWILFMAHAEGYRGFQKAFSPRVAARARYLARHPRADHLLLAPLFCMGFIHATSRRRIVATSITGGVITLVLLVRLLPQPWRGIVDAGVVLGLTWGLVALLVFSWRAATDPGFAPATDVPGDDPRPSPQAK